MYINGVETSHYTEKDFEDYRRKYIGNIFQNFNLVNSYTVYQNIELVLLLNGSKKKDIKDKVIELIRTVDLYKFRNTKVSKLSGGQKQRVAIARALAKDTPIIIADEPTGNLDSKSAKGIVKLLSEISKNKLVIIVTHNYEQVEDYVTRKIKMHDGKVLEDKVIKDTLGNIESNILEYRNITFLNKLRLGVRNTFNIIPKFLLVFGVYLFITVALISEYGSFRKQEYLDSVNGYNYYFNDTSDNRILLKKNDKSVFNDTDYSNIEKINNIDKIVKEDLLLDFNVNLTDNANYWINSTVSSMTDVPSSVDLGRLPEKDNEIVIEGPEYDYYLGYMGEGLIDKELYIQNLYTGNTDNNNKLKVVGIKYSETNNRGSANKVYVSDEELTKLSFQINQIYSKTKVLFMDKYYNSTFEPAFKINTNDKVPVGSAYISSDYNSLCKNDNCVGNDISVEVKNIYYSDTLNLKVAKSYNSKNIASLLGITDYENNNGTVFINNSDYNKLFNKGNYQISVFVKDALSIGNTVKTLNDNGFSTLVVDTLANEGVTQIIQIFKTIVTIILVVVLFFISYFVIRIILKSRNVYFSTLRMLGASRKVSKNLLNIELLTVSNLAYFSFILVMYLSHLKILNIKFINNIIPYLNIVDYVLLYLILTIMSYLISQKFAKKLFKNTAISTIKEEA